MTTSTTEFTLCLGANGSYEAVFADKMRRRKKYRREKAQSAKIAEQHMPGPLARMAAAQDADDLLLRPSDHSNLEIDWRDIPLRSDVGTDTPFERVRLAFSAAHDSMNALNERMSRLMKIGERKDGGDLTFEAMMSITHVALRGMFAPAREAVYKPFSRWELEVTMTYGRSVSRDFKGLRYTSMSSRSARHRKGDDEASVAGTTDLKGRDLVAVAQDLQLLRFQSSTYGTLVRTLKAAANFANKHDLASGNDDLPSPLKRGESRCTAYTDSWRRVLPAMQAKQTEFQAMCGEGDVQEVGERLLKLPWEDLWWGFDGVDTVQSLKTRLDGLTALSHRSGPSLNLLPETDEGKGKGPAAGGNEQDEDDDQEVEAEELGEDEFARRVSRALKERWVATQRRQYNTSRGPRKRSQAIPTDPSEYDDSHIRVSRRDKPKTLRQTAAELRDKAVIEREKRKSRVTTSTAGVSGGSTAGVSGKSTAGRSGKGQVLPTSAFEGWEARKAKLFGVLQSQYQDNPGAATCLKDMMAEQQQQQQQGPQGERLTEETLSALAAALASEDALFADDSTDSSNPDTELTGQIETLATSEEEDDPSDDQLAHDTKENKGPMPWGGFGFGFGYQYRSGARSDGAVSYGEASDDDDSDVSDEAAMYQDNDDGNGDGNDSTGNDDDGDSTDDDTSEQVGSGAESGGE